MFLISQLSSALSDYISYLPAGLAAAVASIGIEDFKYASIWKDEFIGTLLMIFFTFSPGKWVGVDNEYFAWVCHAIGVVAADKVGGGQHVNPTVSVTMFSLGKCSFSEMYVRICGAMAGGLVAFPLFLKFSENLSLNALGGPTFDAETSSDDDFDKAFLSEFLAAFILLIAIYFLNWEVNFGAQHYWIKQTLTAVVIRYLIVVFPAAGPAINPMLGTSWAVFDSGTSGLPTDTAHYVIYWVASILGGLASAIVYVIFAGGTFFGNTIALGPIKKAPETSSSKKKKKKA